MTEEFGHYVLEDVIGRGGMGEVYRAYDTRRDRTVALKRLPRDLAEDATFQARFRRESKMAARLNEPHIIPIHDFGEIDGHLFLDMRLVEGDDLATLLERDGPLSPRLAVDLVGQIASALQAAHQLGLIHRDVKPSNILVTGLAEDRSTAFAYLVDFGIARSMAGGGTALTSTTGTVGTLGYMAPERISGTQGDNRSDVYSLTCVLYECLTGHPPFRGEAFQVMFAHVNAVVADASNERPDIPRGLDAVIRRGLAKNPDGRFATANSFAAAARAALAAGGVTPPPPPINAPPPQGPPREGPPPPGMPPRPPPASYPSGLVPPAPMPSGSMPSGSMPSGSMPSGVAPGGQRAHTPRPPSGPPRPMAPPTGTPRPPPAPPSDFRPPTAQGFLGTPPPTGFTPRPTRSGSSNNRSLVLLAVATVVALAIGIGVVLAVRGSNGSPSGSGTATPTISPSSSPDFPSGSPTGGSGGASTSGTSDSSSDSSSSSGGVASWSDYSAFTRLIGTGPGATDTAFGGANCVASPADTTVDGMLDEVTCSAVKNTQVLIYVGRFSSSEKIDTYLSNLSDRKYTNRYWTIGGERRGLLYTSPAAIGFSDITTSFCGGSRFLVQIYAGASANITTKTLYNDYWLKSTFPNIAPPVCS